MKDASLDIQKSVSHTKQYNQVEFDPQVVDLIKTTIMPPNSTDNELKLFIEVCKRTQLDPFLKQIFFVKRETKNGPVVSFQTSIDALRIVANRSGAYEGQIGPYWCGKDGEWKDVWLNPEPPVAAKVGVFRAGFKEPIWAVAKYSSYVVAFFGKVSQFWDKMPDLMIAKCAEALALRKAFPNDMSQLYIPEETQGIEDDQINSEIHYDHKDKAKLNPMPKEVVLNEKSDRIDDMDMINSEYDLIIKNLGILTEGMGIPEKAQVLTQLCGVNKANELKSFSLQKLSEISREIQGQIDFRKSTEKRKELMDSLKIESDSKKTQRPSFTLKDV